MTPTEVLKEIRNLPIADKRRVFDELKQDLSVSDRGVFGNGEPQFLERMKRKGLIIDFPRRDKIRPSFKRISVTGEPVSETIIKERG